MNTLLNNLNKSYFLILKALIIDFVQFKQFMTDKFQHDNINHPQYDHLSLELIQYRKLNADLKKKIKAKDRQINYLFSCIDQIAKPELINPQSNSSKIRNLQEKNQILTDIKKREKQNVNFLNYGENRSIPSEYSIFKHVSTRNMTKLGKQEIRFPSLDKKNVFHNELTYHTEQSIPKQKIIKVSADRLIPLKPQEVKKKYQLKFKKEI